MGTGRLSGIGARRGLTLRVVVASALLCLLIGGAFAALVGAIGAVRHAAALARRSEKVLMSANDLERLIVDVETGQRGFVITGDERFLQPWTEARAAFEPQATNLQRLAAADRADQGARARRIAHDGESYIHDYSDRVVADERRDPATAQTAALTEEGRRRTDRLRKEFQQFGAVERTIVANGDKHSADTVRQATAVAIGGIAGSIALICLFGGYLARGVVRPVRRASRLVGELARGDLTVRMPESGPAEIGKLEQSFNTMAGSLEKSRDELGRIANEQAALRRVATLVALGVPPSQVFKAVATEVGHVLNAEHTAMRRYEADNSVTVVGSWTERGAPDSWLPVGSRWPLVGTNVAAVVRRTGCPGRMTADEAVIGKIAEWARDRGIRSTVGAPIMVEGRVWGLMTAYWIESGPQAEDVEKRMCDFTGLVAAAIANTESRAELAASRARVVEAGDAARRRIERDLHDGTQQRLVTLELELRLAEADVPGGCERLRKRLSRSMRELTGVIDDLREVSRGIHPAMLSKGGLVPALNMLARRSAVPVELAMNVDGRLSDRIEVAAYYVVSEALTNAAKHAHATWVHVAVNADDAAVRLRIQDNGVGGADPGRGSGLVGLADRVEAIGGSIQVSSPEGEGTTLLVRIPIDAIDPAL